jgi:hypothetical protein
MAMFTPVAYRHSKVAPFIPPAPDPTQDPIVTTNLVFHYDYSNTACYPGTGTTVTDLISSTQSTGTEGTLTFNSSGSIGWMDFSAGQINTNIRLDSLISSTTSAYSVDFWMRRSAFGFAGFNNFVFGTNRTSSTTSLSGWNVAQYTDTGPDAQILVSNAAGTSNFFTTLQDFIPVNVWHHYVITFAANSTGRLYINGANTNKTMGYRSFRNATENALLLAPGRGFDTAKFTGELAVQRIYSKELTSAEVATNWEAQRYRFGR